MDDFTIIANELHFGPWLVGTLRSDIPASVRDRFEPLIERTAAEMFTLEDTVESYDEGFAAREEEVGELKRRVERLTCEVEDLEKKLETA